MPSIQVGQLILCGLDSTKVFQMLSGGQSTSKICCRQFFCQLSF